MNRSWAKQKIEWFDPFTCEADEILNDYDRNTLIDGINESKFFKQKSFC